MRGTNIQDIKHTLTEFRQRFWIVQRRKLVRNLLRKNIISKKLRGSLMHTRDPRQ